MRKPDEEEEKEGEKQTKKEKDEEEEEEKEGKPAKRREIGGCSCGRWGPGSRRTVGLGPSWAAWGATLGPFRACLGVILGPFGGQLRLVGGGAKNSANSDPRSGFTVTRRCLHRRVP